MQYLLAVVLLSAAIFVGSWDIVVNYRGEPGSSVSSIIQGWSMKWPVLPLVFGVLLGHVFWPPDCPKPGSAPRVEIPLDEPIRIVPK